MSTIRTNRRARYDYAVKETFDAGVELEGWEVKAIKNGNVSLQGSFVRPLGSELFLVNASVTPPFTSEEKQSDRTRKLLLHRKEIDFLLEESKKGGFSIVPLKIFTNRGLIKIQIGLAKGKKRFEQAATKKKKAIDRRLQREIKNYKAK